MPTTTFQRTCVERDREQHAHIMADSAAGATAWASEAELHRRDAALVP